MKVDSEEVNRVNMVSVTSAGESVYEHPRLCLQHFSKHRHRVYEGSDDSRQLS